MDKSKISINDFLELKTVEDIQVSGNRVAWVEKKPDPVERGYVSHIKLLDRNTGDIHQFTSGTKSDYAPKFSPNGKKLAFLSTRAGKPQIFLMNVDGGEALQLSKTKTGVSYYSWNFDSCKILYSSLVSLEEEEEEKEDKVITKFKADRNKAEDDEKERQKKDPIVVNRQIYRTGTSFLDETRYNHLFVIDIEEKKPKRITDGEFNYGPAEWMDEDTVITAVKKDQPTDTSVYQYYVKIAIDEPSTGENLIKTFNPTIFLSPAVVNQHDPSTILVIITEEDYPTNKYGQIRKWGLLKKDGLYEIINKDLDRSLGKIRWISSNQALVQVDDRGYSQILKYSLSSKEFTRIYEPAISILSFDGTSEIEFFVTGTSPSHPSAVWKYKDDGFELIYDPNEELLKEKQIVQPEEVWFENAEGIKYQGWFFQADELNGIKPALIVSLHGGPHVMWNNAGSMWHEWQSQVAAGYSVLALNPIGSDGYGEDFLRKISARWGIEDARDCLHAVDQITHQNKVDVNRMYVTGGSFAGFQVANIITKDHRFKAACAQRGVYDMLTIDAGADLANFAEQEYSGDMWENFKLLWEHSPVSQVKNIQTPLLIIHSENDFRAAISQAEMLFSA
ncbi:MAG: S9 family peptidase, partial [Candidatus Kariarchaeaceae archaeon]